MTPAKSTTMMPSTIELPLSGWFGLECRSKDRELNPGCDREAVEATLHQRR